MAEVYFFLFTEFNSGLYKAVT